MYTGNCGNLSSAVGSFALESGILKPQNHDPLESTSDPTQLITLSLLNTNTNKRINTSFPTNLNAANAESSFSLDGVSGTGARISMDYLEPGGARTGKLFPTGNKIDTISITLPASSNTTGPMEDVPVTLLDCTNPTVYVRFSDLHLHLDPNSVSGSHPFNERVLQVLEAIRRRGAELMGLDPSAQSQPKIALVGPPLDYELISGGQQGRTQIDLFIRALSMGQPHKAVPMTVAMATAVAARIDGTVVSLVTAPLTEGAQEVRIGHPSGTVAVGADITPDGHVRAAKVFRTARILMRGEVYW